MADTASFLAPALSPATSAGSVVQLPATLRAASGNPSISQRSSSTNWFQLAGAAGTCVLLAHGTSRSARRSHPLIVRAAAEAAEAAEVEEAEVPAKDKDADEVPPTPTWDPATEVGAMEPLGFFDPLKFTKKNDKVSFDLLRAAEVKHGRVAMMAAVGAVVQCFVKFPGFESVPSGLSAVATPPGTYGFLALFIVSGALELSVWTENPDKEPGNFGDPLGLGMYDTEMRNRELNNGRFAMFAAAGIIAAELLTGKNAVSQLF